jgi:hypothetical protein
MKFPGFLKDCFPRKVSLKLEAVKQDHSTGDIAFGQMRTAFERAWTTHRDRRSESRCTFAGRTGCMRVVGQGLSTQMNQAFRHLLLQESPLSVELKIDLWDEGDTSVSCPIKSQPVDERLLQSTSYVEFGLILGSLEDRFIGCQRPQVLTWFDRSDQHVIGCISSHDQLSLYDRGKPLHLPLLLWHTDQKAEVIHAALVAKNGGGVLLAGKGGVGKSTAALACFEAGFDYVGDDYIGLQACEDGTFVGHSVYSATWLMADHLMRFPGSVPHAIYPADPSQEKTLIVLSQLFQRRLLSHTPIRALMLPRITAASSAHIRPARRAEALFALAPSSILLRPGSGAGTLAKLGRLAEQVPCFWLELGQDLREIPRRIDEVIDFTQPV